MQNKSSAERIEEELAKARAAIRKAIITKNYTSDGKEIYIPRGSVYRNPYAFHQLSFFFFFRLIILFHYFSIIDPPVNSIVFHTLLENIGSFCIIYCLFSSRERCRIVYRLFFVLSPLFSFFK